MAEDQRQLKCSHRWQEDFSCPQSLCQGFKSDPPHPSAAGTELSVCPHVQLHFLFTI